jgi:hypothetical protein
LGLGNLECKLQVSKNEDPMSWKSCPKNFQVWVLETHTVYVPKLKSHVLKIMSLKISCLGFGEPPVQANSRWPKIETVKNSRDGQWLKKSSRHYPHIQTLLL